MTEIQQFDPETELLRCQLVEEWNAENSLQQLTTFGVGSFGCHELFDRTFMVASMLDDFVLTHPACINNPEWFALAKQSLDLLYKMYQEIGAVHLDR